jgi:U2-associated protein SR140
MWPRGDARETPDISARRNKASGLSGFVSFRRRKDAEAALRDVDGVVWAGSTLRVGWSKAVPTSGVVLYGVSHFAACQRVISYYTREEKFKISLAFSET